MKSFKTKALALAVTLAPFASFAEGDVATAMAPVQTQIIGYIAAAGAAGVAIMAVGLGWDVGMNLFKKFLKKGSR